MARRNDLTPTRKRDRILLAALPLPMRRAAGMGLLGVTLWLAGMIALFS
jgi:hypothetical protein